MKRRRPGARRLRALTWLFPGPVREAHGRDIRQVWQAQHDAASSTADRARFWSEALSDVLRTAPRQHLDELRRDLRYAFRGLRLSPGFAITAVLTIALGVGATSGVFMLLDAVLLRPLPYRDPSRVGLVWAVGPGGEHTWLSAPELDDLGARSTTLEGIAGLSDLRMILTGAGDPRELQAAGVSATLFPLLGVEAQAGRLFGPADDREGSGLAVVLSDRFWRTQFGGRSAVIGTGLTLNDRTYTIAGVLPASFTILPPSSVFPAHVDVWVPLQTHLASRGRDVRMLHAVARLRPNATFSEAAAELSSVGLQVSRDFSSSYPNGAVRFDIVSMRDDVLKGVRPALAGIACVVALVLGIACANVASLLLARAESRRREMAIRASLGASRARLARQLLTEGGLLAAIGGALGLGLAGAAMTITSLPVLSHLPRIDQVGYGWRVVLFTALVSLGTAVLFALAPALELSRHADDRRTGVLREGARGPRATRVGRLLATIEVALAAAGVVVALTMALGVARALTRSPGFEPSQVLTMRLSTMPGVRRPAESPTFFDRVIEEVRAVPGVTSASAVTQLPMSGAMLGSSFRADDRPDAAPVDADLRGITTDYFQTMGIALTAGRAFDAGDDERGRRVAIVDEGLARRLSMDGQAVGRRIRWIRQPDVPIEIVGVVRAVRHRGLDQEPVETVYRPHAQYPRGSMYLTVRVAGEPTAWSGSVAAAVHRVDPSQLVADVAPLSALERRSIAQPGLGALVGGLLGTLALVMTAVGVYGLFAFAVAQRRREMAIRLAVGATPGGIVRLIARDGARIVGLGLAIGLPVAFVAAQLLGSLMPAVAATGQGPFLYGAGLVIVVAAIACGVPARRASRIEPNAVLRAE